ncbi:PREDICTED: carbohydrate sulfotransferase 10-like [Branchiostoma belcheri]|uniref:Carbohydrate sulfotransferase n=1 Tax=Branchiostoma belcheri TaxID=7741 RepID=A0A6P4Y8R5_BRABE|nr:PREDICTED: carbohydrate sulfotransferase 10-like [Branchiostoma belcheri]
MTTAQCNFVNVFFIACAAVLMVTYLYVYNNLITTNIQFKKGNEKVAVAHGPDYDDEKIDMFVEEEQIRRASLLAKYCKSNGSLHANSLKTFYFVVYDKKKIIYCRTGKTGSTTTSRLLYNLENGVNLNAGAMKTSDSLSKPRLLNSYTEEEIALRLSTYFTLLVTRNPIERLASAWMSRFLSNPHLRYNEQYRSMLQTISSKESNVVKETKGDNMTKQIPFLAFVRAATDNKKKWENRHWIPVSDACSPCKVPYDFIAHTETLADDLRLFLRKVGVTNRDHILPRTKQRAAAENLPNIYGFIPMEDVKRVIRKFKSDFEMFGYSYEEKFLEILKT